MKEKRQKVPEYIRKQRGDWRAISPVTKVIPNKKRETKEKHKKKLLEGVD